VAGVPGSLALRRGGGRVQEVLVLGYNFGVGREAPQLQLPSADGETIALQQYRGDWFPVVVFFRGDPVTSAAAVSALGARADELWGYRGQLLGVFTVDAETLSAKAAEAGAASFPLLADADGAAARAYGAWDVKAGASRDYVVIVDRAGKIVWTADGGVKPVKAAEVVAGMRSVAR
jgi:peroxiredoxin